MPNSRFALHARPSLIHGLCAIFASNSRFMRLFRAPLDTPLDSPFSATPSVHGLHFTVSGPLICHENYFFELFISQETGSFERSEKLFSRETIPQRETLPSEGKLAQACPSFPCFLAKTKEKHPPPQQGFFILTEPPRSFQKTREGCGCPKFPAGKVFRQISMLIRQGFARVGLQADQPDHDRVSSRAHA